MQMQMKHELGCGRTEKRNGLLRMGKGTKTDQWSDALKMSEQRFKTLLEDGKWSWPNYMK